MEEKILIKSERNNVKNMFKTIIFIGALFSVILFLCAIADYMNTYDRYYETYKEHQADGDCGWGECWACEAIEEHSTSIGYAFTEIDGLTYLLCLIPVAALTLIGALIYLWLRSYELTVTDKRIYGKVAFGKRVDLPVDSISATSTIRLLKGVSVSTSSGRISFRVIKNADEIYTVMNNLLIERQQNKANATVSAPAPATDEADQLKKFKELLDMGVITEEEFNAKKKQLLGL